MLKPIGALAGLVLLASCASTDVRQEHLLACEGYTVVLEQIAVRKEAGLFDADEVEAIQRVVAQTTPLCMGEAPTAEGLALVNQGLTSLEILLLTAILE